jgi:tRNA modification GTPase
VVRPGSRRAFVALIENQRAKDKVHRSSVFPAFAIGSKVTVETSSNRIIRLTATGRGAVASLRYFGSLTRLENPEPLFRAANGKRLSQQPVNRIVFGLWGTSNREDIVVCRTAAQSLEIHCHGGEAAVRRIMDDLVAREVQIQSHDIAESFAASVFDREMDDALTRATTLRTATIILRQRNGLLRDALHEFCTTSNSARALERLRRLVGWSQFGIHLTQPWKVVIVGRPNVGKSSLINALVGYERSIVFDQPGTTRDVVSVETAVQGWPVALSDTAGIRSGADQLETKGIERARRILGQADLRIILLDVSQQPHPDDEQLMDEFPNAIIVAHKSDLPVEHSSIPETALPVASIHGDGLDVLMNRIAASLVPTLPDPDEPVPVTSRQVALLEQALGSVSRNDQAAAIRLVRSVVDG